VNVSRLLILVAIILSLCPVAWAQPPDLTGQLHLSRDQQTKLEAIHHKYADRTRALKATIAAKRRELASQMSAEAPDRATVERQMQEIVTLEGQRQKLLTDEFFEVLGVLKPDQQKLFRARVVKQIR
jgi:Spy/CpxP family protein refolding chaperone